MVEQAPQYRLGQPDVDPFDENTADHGVARYRLRRSARTDYPEDSVPLFLSDCEGEPDPSEYITPLRKDRRLSVSSRILAGVLASAAIAILVALFSSDAARDIIASAKASSIAVFSAASAAVQPNPTQLTARGIQLKDDPAQLKDPTRLSTPANQTPGLRSVTTAAVAPTREDIKTAYQSALQGGAPRAAAVAEPMIPGDAIHRLDPNEIASSLRRGDALIASGDLAAARLVLRRAAEAGDARAAMTLAETYDPAILEKMGVHGVVPDLAMARGWYEKAKQFGATEATQRLELLASKQH
jgi:TPR repeat protein